MKRLILLGIVSSGLALLWTSCSSKEPKDSKPDTQVDKELNRAKKAYQEEVAEYITETRRQINENQNRIDEIRADKRTWKDAAANKRQERLVELEKTNAELEEKLKKFVGKTSESLEDFREEMKRDMYNLGKSINELGSDDVTD